MVTVFGESRKSIGEAHALAVWEPDPVSSVVSDYGDGVPDEIEGHACQHKATVLLNGNLVHKGYIPQITIPTVIVGIVNSVLIL